MRHCGNQFYFLLRHAAKQRAITPKIAAYVEGSGTAPACTVFESVKKLSEELGIGEMTLSDIANELAKPGRDPRDELPPPLLRTDVADINSLKPGMILDGTVRNVIDFGVFVDIGVHQDGLVHISQICDKYIKHPLEVVKVGDIVKVKVLDIDPAKKRISLTMKGV